MANLKIKIIVSQLGVRELEKSVKSKSDFFFVIIVTAGDYSFAQHALTNCSQIILVFTAI